MKKVVLYQDMHTAGINLLKENGCEVIIAPDYTEETICELVADADAIIIRAMGAVTTKIIQAAPQLKVIGNHGVGTENIDIEAATARGIYVVNTPQANTQAVVEMTIAHMLSAAKRLVQADNAVRNGDWQARYRLIGSNIEKKTLGIIGFGQIGRKIALIASQAFGMKIIFYDIFEVESEYTQLELEPLVEQADFISVNVPKTSQTTGLLNAELLEKCKQGGYLINTARGGIVDESVVAHLVSAGHLAGAAFDVFQDEPVTPDNPLLQVPNISFSPHMAAHTDEAMMNMSMVAEDVLRVFDNQPPEYPVNRPL